MVQVRCPKCAAALAIKQAPQSGKMKCPKCATIFPVAGTAGTVGGSTQTRGSTQPGRTQAGEASGEIDFRSIPIPTPSAPSGHFPLLGQSRVYDGPISLDPMPAPASEASPPAQGHGQAHATAPAAETSRSPKSTKAKKKLMIISIIAGLFMLVAAGGGAYWFLGGSSDGSTTAAQPSGSQ